MLIDDDPCIIVLTQLLYICNHERRAFTPHVYATRNKLVYHFYTERKAG